MKVSIVLADDHRVVREGLRMLLEVKGGATVVAEAGDVVGARRALHEHNPDVLVLDVNMPGESGLSALSRLREEYPDTAIVVLTMQADPQLAREALREGALGYVLKEGAHALLLEAVKAATAGRTYLDPLLGAQLAAEPPAHGPPDGLTRREVEVLQLLAAGHTNAEIGKELFMSVRTAETHRAQIQRKTRCSSRAQLTRYAREHGLTEPWEPARGSRG